MVSKTPTKQILSLLHSKSILIACIQETKLTPSSKLRPFPDYTSDTRAAARGYLIDDLVTDNGLIFLNSDSPTRLPSHGNPSSPDLTIATPHIGIDSEWSTLITLNSDHLPVFIRLGGAFSTDFPEHPHRTFTNLRRADWTSFTRVTEEGFSGLAPPSSCSAGEG